MNGPWQSNINTSHDGDVDDGDVDDVVQTVGVLSCILNLKIDDVLIKFQSLFTSWV